MTKTVGSGINGWTSLDGKCESQRKKEKKMQVHGKTEENVLKEQRHTKRPNIRVKHTKIKRQHKERERERERERESERRRRCM